MELVSINQSLNSFNICSSDELVVFIFDNDELKYKFNLCLQNSFDFIYKEFVSTLYIFGFEKIIISGNYQVYQKLKEKFEVSKDYTFFKKIYENIVVEYSTDKINKQININSTFLSYGNIGKTIGIDIGGSDIKVACLIDSKIIYTNEIIWHPKSNNNLDYHINMINSVIDCALSYLNNDVDSIKISSAGVIKNNQVLLANIFKNVIDVEYKNIYIDIIKNVEKKLNKKIDFFVFNDGDVSSLFGANYYNVNNMLGLALGTSLAAGYINDNKLYDYLNEPSTIMFFKDNDLPISDYLSQEGVINLAKKYKLNINENLTKYEKLKCVQELFNNGDNKAKLIFKDLGYLLADFISYLSRFIKIENVILLGRVLSNNSGKYMYECLISKLSNNINVYLPDGHFVRIGQAVSVANIVKKY